MVEPPRSRYDRVADSINGRGGDSWKSIARLRSDCRASRSSSKRRGEPERFAWSLLRNRGVLGLKFRGQHVLHGFIVDFCCLEAGIVIELDGHVHNTEPQRGYDAARGAVLKGAGFQILRIANRDVTRDDLAVRRAIGLVFQETTLDRDLTVQENLTFAARLAGLGRQAGRRAVGQAMEHTGLTARARQPARQLSGGLRRLADIARARRDLGYAPNIELIEGLRRTVAHLTSGGTGSRKAGPASPSFHAA